LVARKDHSKGRVSAGAFELLGEKLGKGMDKELEGSSSNFLGFSRDRVSLFNSLQMLHVGRDKIKRKVIHTFIKANMRGNLDSLSIHIIPENIRFFAIQAWKEQGDVILHHIPAGMGGQ